MHESGRPSLTVRIVIALLTVCATSANGLANEQPPNVLLICIDDLRSVPGCYNGPAITPNIDRLAASGTHYQHHYVQFPVCGPSRAAMLSGQRPQTTRIFLNEKGSNDPPKEAAYSMCIRKHHCYSVRTADFRYNEWRDRNNGFKLVHRELFDYRNGNANL